MAGGCVFIDIWDIPTNPVPIDQIVSYQCQNGTVLNYEGCKNCAGQNNTGIYVLY